MQRLFTALALLVAGTAQAEGQNVCVRNFLHALPSDPGIDICEQFGGRYVHAQPQDETQARLCVITFDDSMCVTAPREYRRILSAEGAPLCVVDFNQPSVVNYCESVPELYDYAKVAE